MNPLLSLQAELARAYEASDSYLAIVRRVHAEWGPKEVDGLAYWECSCLSTGPTIEEINHFDCLWLAADACIKKIGEL